MRNYGESFTVDAWGNLTEITPTKCSVIPLSTGTSSKNQLTDGDYDPAGNMKQRMAVGTNS